MGRNRNGDRHVVCNTSRDRVVVTAGPLKGLESSIVRIDRHKRKAWLHVTMFCQEKDVEVGLKIVSKI